MSTNTKSDYMLLFRGNERFNHLSAEELETVMSKARAWFEKITARGIGKGGAPLTPEGKLVSGKGGQFVADGPFAESKEAIGGYLILAADSLEEAVAIARTNPALDHGTSIEVRVVAAECPLVTRAKEIAAQESRVPAGV